MSGSLNAYYVPPVQPNQSLQFPLPPPHPPPPPPPQTVNVTTSPQMSNVYNNSQIPLVSPSTNILGQSTQFSNVLIDAVVSLAHIQVLVDTGAAVTVVSTEFYHNILSTLSPLEHSQVLQSVKTANGAHIPIEGIVTFDLGLGQTKYRCSA